MAEPACRPHEGGTSVHFVLVSRRAEVRPFGGGAAGKGSVTTVATVGIALIGVGVRREQAAPRKRREREKKEKHDACHSMASPDTVIHATPLLYNDFSQTHRPPPFFQTRFVSFSNEPLIEGKIRCRTHPLSAHRISFS
jgi:hypothetical protein